MADTALPYSNKIIRASSGSLSFSSISAKFSDGLSQSAPNGLNPITETWDLTWMLTQTEFNALMTVLRSVGSWGILTWTTPYEARSLRWKLSESKKPSWKRAGVANAKFEVSCTLEQYYGV